MPLICPKEGARIGGLAFLATVHRRLRLLDSKGLLLPVLGATSCLAPLTFLLLNLSLCLGSGDNSIKRRWSLYIAEKQIEKDKYQLRHFIRVGVVELCLAPND
jgi:hypothetical protein